MNKHYNAKYRTGVPPFSSFITLLLLTWSYFLLSLFIVQVCSELQEEFKKNPGGLPPKRKGLIVAAIIGGSAVAISAICVPFVTPALRRWEIQSQRHLCSFCHTSAQKVRKSVSAPSVFHFSHQRSEGEKVSLSAICVPFVTPALRRWESLSQRHLCPICHTSD